MRNQIWYVTIGHRQFVCRPPKVILDKGADSVFEKSNQCSKQDCKAAILKYIDMPAPCYNLPTECPGVEVECTDPEIDPEDDEPESAGIEFDKRDNHRHKGHHPHGHDHHYDKSGHKKKMDEKKGKHPWAGLCVDSSSFCGNSLFGCDFILNSVYSCEKTAGKPTFVKTCDGECSAGTCGGNPIPGTSEAPTGKPTGKSSSQPTNQTTNQLSSKPTEPNDQPSISPAPTNTPNPTQQSPILPNAAARATALGCAVMASQASAASLLKADPLKASCVTPPPPEKCLCNTTNSVCGSTDDPQCISDIQSDSIYNSADIYDSAFLNSHKVDPKSLYHYAGTGAQPKKNEVCTKSCPNVDGPDSCKKPDKCVCQEVASYCGSGLSDVCHAKANSRCACLEVGKTPQFITNCGDNEVKSECDDVIRKRTLNAIYSCPGGINALPKLV
ncbi:hypothetical protein BGZ59_010937 [Podila verticillata]|nr:hypothetical protein BGZ59_010937 [Podila verticillata]